jgi:hypothetical protein
VFTASGYGSIGWAAPQDIEETGVTTEDKFVIALGVLSIALLAVGSLFAKRLASAPPRVMRTVWPIAAVVTAGVYATFVFIARTAVKG